MKPSKARIGKKLRPLGFKIERDSIRTDGYEWGRQRTDMPILEWINAHLGGKKLEAAAAYVSISVTRVVGGFGLGKFLLLKDFPHLTTRGHTILDTEADARAWEDRLVEIGPPAAAALAVETGPALLESTAAARQAAEKYLALLRPLAEAQYLEQAMRNLCQPAEIDSAYRLAEWPGVLLVRGAQDIYLTVCMAILHFAPRVETDHRSFHGVDPLREKDHELMKRIQLLADALLWEKARKP
jgi:hypothetical protein